METNDTRMVLANNLAPAYPIHPGSILGEELKERSIRQKEFAAAIGMQASHLNAVIQGVRNITPAIAAKIHIGLPDISESFWINLQERFNSETRRRKAGYSRLVTGYIPKGENSQIALAEQGTSYGQPVKISLSVSGEDIPVIKALAFRLGWVILSE